MVAAGGMGHLGALLMLGGISSKGGNHTNLGLYGNSIVGIMIKSGRL